MELTFVFFQEQNKYIKGRWRHYKEAGCSRVFVCVPLRVCVWMVRSERYNRHWQTVSLVCELEKVRNLSEQDPAESKQHEYAKCIYVATGLLWYCRCTRSAETFSLRIHMKKVLRYYLSHSFQSDCRWRDLPLEVIKNILCIVRWYGCKHSLVVYLCFFMNLHSFKN